MSTDAGLEQAKSKGIRSRMLRNTISNYIGEIFTLGVWFFLTPFLLRQLGPSTYGLWILISSLAAYGSLLDFGITNAVIKYVAQYHAEGRIDQARSLVATALWLYTGLGLLAVVLSAMLAPIIPDVLNLPPAQRTSASWLMLVSGLTLGVTLPSGTSLAVLRGLHRFDLSNLVSIIGMTVYTVAVVGVLLFGGGVVGIAAVNIPITLVMQIPTVWLIHRVAPELRFGWRGASGHLLKTVTSFSSALFVINLSGLIQTKTDEIVIGAFLPIAYVTPYSLARRLSELPKLLTDQFMKVLMPLASQLHAENDAGRLRVLYITSTRLTLAIFLSIATSVVILAQPFLTVWVGPIYGNYAYLVLILAVASFVDTSQWPAGSILQGMGRLRLLALLTFCTALANLGISITLLPVIGLAGVAFGTLIPATIESFCFVMPYAMRLNQVKLRTTLTEIFLPTLLPAALTAVVLYGLREVVKPDSWLSLAVTGGMGFLVYVVAYMTIGAGQAERQLGRDLALSVIRFARMHLRHAKSDT